MNNTEMNIDIDVFNIVYTLNVKQVIRMVEITCGLASAHKNIMNALRSISGKNPYLDSILNLRLDKGPQDIDTQVTNILSDLVRGIGPNTGKDAKCVDLSHFDQICTSLKQLLPILSPIFSDWLGNLNVLTNLSEVLKELIELGATIHLTLLKIFIMP